MTAVTTPPVSGTARTAADVLRPVVRAVFGDDLPVTLRCWDGSRIEATTVVDLTTDGRSSVRAPNRVLDVRSPLALRRMLWTPGEIGVARAYVAGELDFSGDVFEFLSLRDHFGAASGRPGFRPGLPGWFHAARAATELGVLGPPPAVPPEEVRIHGRRHSRARDASAISHHYDVSNDFYRLFLGETMTYSCGYFPTPTTSLDDAQRMKYELVCRKLGLRPGMRLLDVGCGWGGMVLHAAEHYGVEAVGVTLSTEQAELARARVAAAGLEDRIEIRVQDYRDVHDTPFDAISSIGMFEHVGLSRLREYFADLFVLLRPGGRLLNHGISTPKANGRFDRRSFINRYVFPDGELHEVGRVVSTMQAQGFEVRDVESLREHYARTLRHWVANLETRLADAVALTGEGRVRVWRLYMAGSALGFEDGTIGIHQVLAGRKRPGGGSGFAPTRDDWAVPLPDTADDARVRSGGG